MITHPFTQNFKLYSHSLKMNVEEINKLKFGIKSSSYMALQLFYRVLAFLTNSSHFLLSWARVFQFGTFIFCISFLTSSSQQLFCLPIGLLEMGFQEYIAFTILVTCILSMWPSTFHIDYGFIFSFFVLYSFTSFFVHKVLTSPKFNKFPQFPSTVYMLFYTANDFSI